MLLAIDGYNFIKQSPGLRRLEQLELQKAREGLIDRLARYKRVRNHSILVVFDGRNPGGADGRGYRTKGIEVIFSRGQEKADDILKRLAAEKREGITIVTSDNDIAFYAERKGAAVISTPEFAERMEMADFYEMKGGGERPEGSGRWTDTSKKGPSRRLPKSQRRKETVKKKL